MARRGRRAADAGFTLIESMIAMFIIAFIAGGMGMVASYSGRSTRLANRIAEANMIAEGILEQSRNAAYINLNTQFSTLNSPANALRFDMDRDGVLEDYSETCALAGVVTTCTTAVASYTAARTVTPFWPTSATPFAGTTAVEVAVQVSWPAVSQDFLDPGGATQSVRVATLRSKY